MPAEGRQKQADLREVEVSLVHIVPGHPGLHGQTLSLKKEEDEEERRRILA